MAIRRLNCSARCTDTVNGVKVIFHQDRNDQENGGKLDQRQSVVPSSSDPRGSVLRGSGWDLGPIPMTFTEARAIAADHLSEGLKRPEGYTPIILDANTLELSWGWVFFYNSKKYIDTGDILYALAGNAPIVVTHEGSLHVTGTARPLDEYLKELETHVKV